MKSLKFFLCSQIDGEFYLIADMSQKCFDSDWFLRSIIFIIVIVFYVVGFPVLITIFLYRARKHLDKTETIESLGFLYGSYKRKAYLWEVTLLTRKVFMALGPTVMYNTPIMQTTSSRTWEKRNFSICCFVG